MRHAKPGPSVGGPSLVAVALLVVGLTGCVDHSPPAVEQPRSLPAIPDNFTAANVKLIGQQTKMWCWAASAEMIMKAGGTSPTQCDQATRQFDVPCCGAARDACVRGGWPQFEEFGYRRPSITDSAPLSWALLKHQVATNGAFAFSVKWVDPTTGDWPDTFPGHMMVVYGYQTERTPSGEQHWVLVYDPWPPDYEGPPGGRQFRALYNDYACVDETGTNRGRPGPWSDVPCKHWNDYYNIRRL